MSRVLFALAAVAGFSAISPSLAADMYGSPPPAPGYGYAVPAPSPAATWNGAYLGGQVGHAWGPKGMNGAQAGIYAGINTNVGQNVIVGVEGDLNVSGQTAASIAGGSLYRHESNWNATIRPRIGVGFDKVMPYATGGIAFADDTLRALGSTSNDTKIGYAAGAGVEAQVTDRITVKGELIHMGFGDTKHTTSGVSSTTTTDSNILRGGAAYRF